VLTNGCLGRFVASLSRVTLETRSNLVLPELFQLDFNGHGLVDMM
jgi:hypothetical protein